MSMLYTPEENQRAWNTGEKGEEYERLWLINAALRFPVTAKMSTL